MVFQNANLKQGENGGVKMKTEKKCRFCESGDPYLMLANNYHVCRKCIRFIYV